MKKYFLIVIGDLDNRHSLNMTQSMLRLGHVQKIMDNVYVLESVDENSNMNEIRTSIAGEGNGYCLVFCLDSKISFAWSLSHNNSDMLTNIIKSVRDEEK